MKRKEQRKRKEEIKKNIRFIVYIILFVLCISMFNYYPIKTSITSVMLIISMFLDL